MSPITTKTTGCTSLGKPVITILHEMETAAVPLVPAEIARDVAARLEYGYNIYGKSLRTNWDPALLELYQEVLDGISYAIAAEAYNLIPALVDLAQRVREKRAEKGQVV